MTFKYQIIAFIFGLILFFSFSESSAHTQDRNTEQLFRQMLNKPFHLRDDILKEVYGRVVALPDTTAGQLIENLMVVAREAGDEALVLEIQLLSTYYDITHNRIPVKEAIQAMQTVADRAADKQLWAVQVRALKQIAETWWKHQKYERMFRAFLPLEQLITEVHSTYSPPEATRIKLTGSVYSDIAEAYFFFEDYAKAIHYLKKAVALPVIKYNIFEKVRTWNNLGLCYQKIGALKKSSYYLKKIINYQPQSRLHPLWIAIAGGNLGYNYYRMSRFDKAIPLLKKDIKVSAGAGIYGEAGIATINLIKIRLEQNGLQQAGKLIDRARRYMRMATKDDKLHYMYELYTVMSKWHAAMGHAKKAARYIDSTRAAFKAHKQNFNLLKLMRARQKNYLQRRQMLLAKKQQQLQQRNMVIAFVIILFLASLAAYMFRNRYLSRKQEVKELEIENTAKELEYARTRIKNFARRVKKNNKMITRLKENRKVHSEYAEVLREIRSSSLLTDKDWIQFKQLFDQVYPGYIGRIKEAHPKLTPAQIRFMVLVKLHFTRKEMANILGISPQSLRVTWYRIRKNLDLPKETSARELAAKM